MIVIDPVNGYEYGLFHAAWVPTDGGQQPVSL
jgi:hypothetical protein